MRLSLSVSSFTLSHLFLASLNLGLDAASFARNALKSFRAAPPTPVETGLLGAG